MFANEQDQKEMNYSPVPSGSIVVIQVTLQQPQTPAQDNNMYSVAQTGLRQVNLKCEVVKGSYAGSYWFQNVTLPIGQQKIQLTSKQETSCNIGGAMLKAMCLASNINPNVPNINAINGLRFPVKVKIKDTPREKEGREYWSNEIQSVIVPSKEEYAQVKALGEIINQNGEIVGKGKVSNNSNDYSGFSDNQNYTQSEAAYFLNNNNLLDDMPF